jgi:hypothetical protein
MGRTPARHLVDAVDAVAAGGTMTSDPPAPSPSAAPPAEVHQIDSGVAQAARAYDYLLGGVDNFAVDREAVEKMYASAGGVERARIRVRAQRAFIGRAVRFLAGEAGIRQFLDLGTGIPNADNVHAVAQATAPDARIVYVDHDPVVLAHAHTLQSSTEEGAAAFLYGDMRNHEDILTRAAATLDLAEPTALIVAGVLHHFRDEEEPGAMLRRYLDALPSGSYLVLDNIGKERDEGVKLGQVMERMDGAGFTLVPRTRAELAPFFEGLELVDPGLVYIDHWRPDGPLPEYETRHPCGVARKP